MKRDRLPYLILSFVAFFILHPLIVHGCSCGHDFDFHLINWFEAARQFQHGVLYPQWAATPAWNAGEPRFVFYPPLSWMLGALLGLVMPWTWTPIVYTWLALTASGFALYAAARDLEVQPRAALLAAVVYIVNPYMLFTAYERTAYAELLAAAWIPLLLAAILRRRVTVPRIAIPIALLWFTNAPAAVMGCYTFALLAMLRVVVEWRQSHDRRACTRLALASAAGAVLGLGIAAIYILPAVWERRWVQIKMAIVPGMAIHDNFLFHHTADPDHDAVLRTASFVAVILLVMTLAAFLAATMRSADITGSRTIPLRRLGILALILVFLLTPLSAFVWSHVPEMAFLQFPWRLLAIFAAIFALVAATWLSRFNTYSYRAITLASLLIAAVFVIPSYHIFRQQCDSEDTVAGRLAVFRSANPGTDPTDEYTPNTADNDALVHTNPPYWLVQEPNAPAPTNSGSIPGPAPRTLDLNLATPQVLVLNLRRYPAWDVREQGAEASIADRDDGLIAIPLPAGPTHIQIRWRTSNRIYGGALSLLSLALLMLLWLRGRERRQA